MMDSYGTSGGPWTSGLEPTACRSAEQNWVPDVARRGTLGSLAVTAERQVRGQRSRHGPTQDPRPGLGNRTRRCPPNDPAPRYLCTRLQQPQREPGRLRVPSVARVFACGTTVSSVPGSGRDPRGKPLLRPRITRRVRTGRWRSTTTPTFSDEFSWAAAEGHATSKAPPTWTTSNTDHRGRVLLAGHASVGRLTTSLRPNASR